MSTVQAGSLRFASLSLAALDCGEVDVQALADEIATRLKTAVASRVQVVVDGSMVWLRDVHGTGAGIDVAAHASLPTDGSGADRVRAAAACALRGAQDEMAMVTTDPWPNRGPGGLPDPRAEITRDGETVRLFYGDSEHPLLELEPLRIVDVLTTPSDP